MFFTGGTAVPALEAQGTLCYEDRANINKLLGGFNLNERRHQRLEAVVYQLRSRKS